MNARTIIASICLGISLSSCSFIERNTIGLFSADSAQAGFSSPQQPVPAEDGTNLSRVTVKPQAPAPTATPAPGTRVEVIWAIPKDPVDGFIIRYGYTKTELKFEEKVHGTALDRFDDPKYGFVYRYVLKNVPANTTVYVSLIAYTGNEQSAPSPVFEVAPRKKTP
ncbi:MAG: hypothetical protein J0M12_11480 [Deltaproteobacteria bacterium]|nr:hypothetical protein [Deltaproteobacteria bacterium]